MTEQLKIETVNVENSGEEQEVKTTDSPKEFSEVVKNEQSQVFPGVEKIDKKEILDKRILVKDWKFMTSALYGSEFAVILIDVSDVGERVILGSKVMVDQLRKVTEKPFYARIAKVKNYYRFV